MWWRILVITLASALLGAHFLRYGHDIAFLLYALSPLLLFIKTPWSSRLLQAGFILSSIFVWGVSTFDYVQQRIAFEAPWVRLSIIMFAVIAFTLFAAWCCHSIANTRKVK